LISPGVLRGVSQLTKNLDPQADPESCMRALMGPIDTLHRETTGGKDCVLFIRLLDTRRHCQQPTEEYMSLCVENGINLTYAELHGFPDCLTSDLIFKTTAAILKQLNITHGEPQIVCSADGNAIRFLLTGPNPKGDLQSLTSVQTYRIKLHTLDFPLVPRHFSPNSTPLPASLNSGKDLGESLSQYLDRLNKGKNAPDANPARGTSYANAANREGTRNTHTPAPPPSGPPPPGQSNTSSFPPLPTGGRTPTGGRRSATTAASPHTARSRPKPKKKPPIYDEDGFELVMGANKRPKPRTQGPAPNPDLTQSNQNGFFNQRNQGNTPKKARTNGPEILTESELPPLPESPVPPLTPTPPASPASSSSSSNPSTVTDLTAVTEEKESEEKENDEMNTSN
jgi:hypothetical protein